MPTATSPTLATLARLRIWLTTKPLPSPRTPGGYTAIPVGFDTKAMLDEMVQS